MSKGANSVANGAIGFGSGIVVSDLLLGGITGFALGAVAIVLGITAKRVMPRL